MNLADSLWLEHLLQDLRHSLRMVRRNPSFAAIVILTLALGIGMTTAMFSVVNGVLLKPLPYPEAARLVWIAPHASYGDNSISRADYLLWKGQAHSFEAFTAYGNEDRAMVYDGRSTTQQIGSITGDFWSISGAKPALGRLFREHEQDQLVLSWPLFQERFGGDAGVIGKSTTIGGRRFTVAGVLPKSFRFVFPPDMYPGSHPGNCGDRSGADLDTGGGQAETRCAFCPSSGRDAGDLRSRAADSECLRQVAR
jgi:MacB-like periplasmic core domain